MDPSLHPHAPDARRIVALIGDPRMRARLRDAVPDAARLTFARDVHELRALARTPLPLHAIVLEPHDPLGVDLAPTVRWLRTRFPPLPVLAYCASDAGTSDGMIRLARAGASQLLIRDLHDSPHALRAALTLASDHDATERTLAALHAVTPPPAWPIVQHCTRLAHTPLTVHALASALGVTRQRLAARLRDAHMPLARELIAWSRLLVALHRLELGGHTIERVALELGFPSGVALHNSARRHLHAPLGALRERGGYEAALAMLLDRIARRVTTR
jgi:hypothetical protein